MGASPSDNSNGPRPVKDSPGAFRTAAAAGPLARPPTYARWRMAEVRSFDEVRPGEDVGGKGLSLSRMAQAGLPVPPGFCVSAAAQRRLRGRPLPADEPLAAEILGAYRRLGGGPVAVRSSATAEDG